MATMISPLNSLTAARVALRSTTIFSGFEQASNQTNLVLPSKKQKWFLAECWKISLNISKKWLDGVYENYIGIPFKFSLVESILLHRISETFFSWFSTTVLTFKNLLLRLSRSFSRSKISTMVTSIPILGNPFWMRL